MEEIIRDSAIHIEKQSSAQGEPPLLVRQHMEPPRKFIFLTAQVYDRYILLHIYINIIVRAYVIYYYCVCTHVSIYNVNHILLQGAIILMQVRPVDILRQLLLEQRGPDTEAVRAYFQTQSLEQACATCLILATLESSQNAQVKLFFIKCKFIYLYVYV